MSEAADYVDDAMDVLGGEDSGFLVKGIPGSREHPYAVGLFCLSCSEPGNLQGVYSVGQIELWELVADARDHYKKNHRLNERS